MSTKLSLKDVLKSKKMSVLLLMGFASGLPFPLTHSTIQAWMKTSGLSLEAVGNISTIIAYPYVLKFLWAPFLDRIMPSFLGLRRGWLMITQLMIVALLIAIGFFDPFVNYYEFILLALLLSFAGASQDIAIDAYRAEILDQKERGFAMPTAILGYRIALIVGASLALTLVASLGWQMVYVCMAGFMFIGVLTTLWCNEPEIQRSGSRSLKDSFVLPLKDFLKRPGAYEILAFVFLYKFGEILATSLTTPFMIELGFTLPEIGAVTKGVGLLATIIGAAIGGAIMIYMSLKSALWLFGIIQSLATISYLILAEVGKNIYVMGTCIAVENLCLGMATSAFTAFLISLCNTKFTATQYALLTSLMALVHTNAPALAGKMVTELGWVYFFIACIFLTIPGLLLLLRYDHWFSVKTEA